MADIQQRLVELGYDAGAADGLLGPKTGAALRAFQSDRGLPVTGRPDDTTLRALFANVPSAAPADAGNPDGGAPSLEAVPLKPVQVAPLAPLPSEAPHEGPTAEFALTVRPDEISPSARTDRAVPLPEPVAPAAPEPRDDGFKWAAAALAALGILILLAAVRRRGSGRPAGRPVTGGAMSRPSPTQEPATGTGARGGHVFGVDVPPQSGREPG
jgi:Putative peptidoglycan binding domain